MKSFISIDQREQAAARRAIFRSVIRNAPLSGYLGSRAQGGIECSFLEREWSETFGVKHSVAVNSATSGLLAACMAIGIKHGDEVIVSPYTMSATAAAPKVLGATIRFADIEPDTYCIDPSEVANTITPRTKAVIATNLFGHPARLHDLRGLCETHGIYLIEDNAQAIFAKEHGVYTGTIGHIGVFSLNVHKHLQVGEGGVCCTNSNELAKKLREAMNHGEMRDGIIGLNLRMTEVTAAMAREQLKKAPGIMAGRKKLVSNIWREMVAQEIRPMTHWIRPECEHSFYCLAMMSDREPIRELPVPFKRGYLKPLYQLKAFEQTFISLPVVETVESKIVVCEVCSIDPSNEEIIAMVQALGEAL